MTHYGMRTLMLSVLALFCSTLLAAEMNFKGTLVEPPPCTINNDQDVLVSFGDSVGVSKVDGSNYIQPVDYHLMCDVTSPQDGLNIMLTTTNQSGFDAAAVQSSVEGLGIRLLVDGQPAEFDKPIPASVDRQPVLQAVPVKAPGVSLTEGPFSATATLQVIYQ
ncbi:fimbrial protein [Klebsiella aerogenes]|uniref:fimbrial protein n=1 Tax=Klebsiella aerogenes TaxID=548 RepID=UPI002DB880CA|nr:fimbrial protein [Klebsiella aerogenes]MEB5742699.1 fimbrial protein [Klebsiella aerogenes]